ncbi:hypothetical protein ABBQ38_013374 [Trebouxia sp. C0009 RCD-2024]
MDPTTSWGVLPSTKVEAWLEMPTETTRRIKSRASVLVQDGQHGGPNFAIWSGHGSGAAESSCHHHSRLTDAPIPANQLCFPYSISRGLYYCAQQHRQIHKASAMKIRPLHWPECFIGQNAVLGRLQVSGKEACN